jgi:glycosyltransferase involved in cell wall biosynthesis
MSESESHKINTPTDKAVLRVLQVLPELNAGGVERTTVEITEALIEKGHKAHVLSAGGRMENEIAELGGTLHTAPIGSKNIMTLLPRVVLIKKLIKDHNINIVHARSRAPAWPAFLACKLSDTPFVTTYHGIYNAKSALKRFYNSVMAKGDIIIANSNFTRDHIVKTHKTKNRPITVIHRGVDMGVFDPAKVSQDSVTALRAQWAGAEDEFSNHKFIVLPGRLTRWKGQLDALDALVKLPAFCHLICVGDAQGRHDYVKEVEQKVDDLNLTGRVIFAGHRTDMPPILKAADVVLSASNEPEAFGRIAAEAQAMGRPVVATALGGALETVEDKKTGFLVAPGDSAAMTKALQRAMVWPTYDGGHARSRIARHFSKKSLQIHTLDVYRAALKAKNR